MQLPFELATAIEEQLAFISAKKLSAVVTSLSEDYRSRRILNGGTNAYIGTYEEALAYVAFRMPATFAAAYFALSQARERLPDLKPKTLLDVGAGPGTTMWAATMVWPELNHITLIERDQKMMDIGKELVKYAKLPSIRQAEWIKADVMGEWDVPQHDVVIASYVLNELPQQSIGSFALRLWEKTGSLLVFIEPGTPAGFSLIKQVRQRLLVEGASIAAPCPHGKSCPVAEDDWCHFSQRLNRSRLHRQVKGGILSYEDEKFSFVCLSRVPGSDIKGIVVRHPQIKKGHISLRMCTPEGIVNIAVSRKEKERFKQARKLDWGSIVHW
ncbi:ribosomal protein RSM22 (predicted rRNA methylase) [Caldicoprobacter guelmensis]|uniref:small ribosomal subunit Rsm22 family protein n=1 Tax=Caldicoprobacter guelmensis TaxID=1170224 RepID=UPI00195E5D5F|nr:small ribosomal subunit Rsm22 family protein [Caldicoprobacter guelmensis]MBM7582158.1 ribosomal protein RSM22 (predicted rRNA methylase) [Caldicoprobacter guelmensis]